ncbi:MULTISPECIES: undecaprenyldiphospho-muramoylpentapeptide beta-N-acetylglucosaminyltransferase [Prevotella]|jgi:UDP-N-acetylglucosamine--N-acetylmuramyl-(pentapeptide) pyrophosphoryl-undecaprenol N-acetylglucosamine transferase|uniref:undecaprenyldiphospho-muramoylpentapeptide beta-N-acetylglucosaminyltransferase n=1 Tax=Prevotellaceae TaxID=171552 RepID=UPI000F62C799|nr:MULTISPECIES: undecaprenyldiphospho-muramoylpentapeptide beta-N-acetylglucosaminyltransferase [Prevotella]MBS5875006.1 undecaprenyldiphospho-muramoylpentapeptide beta-N-acetylglucosaminyltransferase [Prevotella sp.]HJH76254.1 undecaprenyldiphospho-muramoylpentapeptide beta-N-acetylglucosaminyltransferase [Prevotellaceae bacterium]
MEDELRIIISGGGTGGHIFPAVSIANAIRAKYPEAKILFVGALGRMEMQRVPAAGYEIVGLPISGFNRKNMLKNVVVLYRIWKSQQMAKKIIRKFNPMAAVGVGGYASGPMLNQCTKMGIPCLIQEQNSYAGVTNKILSKKVDRICVAYDGMERFFPADKIVKTGNPVRQALLDTKLTKAEALKSFGLSEDKKTILIVGGSLGARTVNESVLQNLDMIKESGVQFIWQTGKYYNASIMAELKQRGTVPSLHVTDFISDMGAAYKAADLVISRAGASSISEFCLIGKPVILVPSPNVAEDHQTKNAMALVNKNAALYVKDADAPAEVVKLALQTVKDDARLKELSENILKLALPDSADIIANEVVKLARRGH